jgi:hypothetical protein
MLHRRLRRPKRLLRPMRLKRDTSSSRKREPFSSGDEIEPHKLRKQTRAEWFKAFASRPLHDFVVRAFEFNNEQLQERSGNGEWYTDLFHFVWVLRGHGEMQRYLSDAKGALAVVEKYLRGWSAALKGKGKRPPYGFDSDHWLEWFCIPQGRRARRVHRRVEQSTIHTGARPTTAGG